MRHHLCSEELRVTETAYRRMAGFRRFKKVPPVVGLSTNRKGRLIVEKAGKTQRPLDHLGVLRALGRVELVASNSRATERNIKQAARIGAYISAEALKQRDAPPVPIGRFRQAFRPLEIAIGTLDTDRILDYEWGLQAIETLVYSDEHYRHVITKARGTELD